VENDVVSDISLSKAARCCASCWWSPRSGRYMERVGSTVPGRPLSKDFIMHTLKRTRLKAVAHVRREQVAPKEITSFLQGNGLSFLRTITGGG
jgi:hypothetical protein